MSSNISITAGMRNNLHSLLQTSRFQDKTQERLASGKRVNSALDNPTNFFTAQSHFKRAGDLTSRKDGISEALQGIKAANTGITGLTALIETAKSVVQAAIATTSSTDRTTYATTFDSLVTQVTQMAGSSGDTILNSRESSGDILNSGEILRFRPSFLRLDLTLQEGFKVINEIIVTAWSAYPFLPAYILKLSLGAGEENQGGRPCERA